MDGLSYSPQPNSPGPLLPGKGREEGSDRRGVTATQGPPSCGSVAASASPPRALCLCTCAGRRGTLLGGKRLGLRRRAVRGLPDPLGPQTGRKPLEERLSGPKVMPSVSHLTRESSSGTNHATTAPLSFLEAASLKRPTENTKELSYSRGFRGPALFWKDIKAPTFRG